MTWRAVGVPAPHYCFCVPPNPVPAALRLHAQVSLYKLRNCLNIAGERRAVDPYAAPTNATSGLPSVAGGSIVVADAAPPRPTPYRYSALIERAKQLVSLAQQVESSFLAALEKRDAEAYSQLKARQDLDVARGQVRLQELHLREAEGGITLADLQVKRATDQHNYYRYLASGTTPADMLETASFVVTGVAIAIEIASTALYATDVGGALAGVATSLEMTSSLMSSIAAFERRLEEWRFQADLTRFDISIADQQRVLAQDRVAISNQELRIANLHADHERSVTDFLANKFTSAELYQWMSRVLQGAYAFFLRQATTFARLAADQLAFERQEPGVPVIRSDYWSPIASGASQAVGEAPDRRGLTGSARLLQDIYQLDQYAFGTNRRKLQLTKILSLARSFPFEFQRFREVGTIRFATPMELFDRDFPGHYLRLIRRVRVSVIALIPPSQGIRATLATTGVSRVVVGRDAFETTVVHRGPEVVALSSPRDASGVFELDPQHDLLLPFENIGVDTGWELQLQRSANPIDFDSIADVLVSIDYTALHSPTLRQDVIQSLRPTVDGERPFSVKSQLPDVWYDLVNSRDALQKMLVTFDTARTDFPAGLDHIEMRHVTLYFSPAPGRRVEISWCSLELQPAGTNGVLGGRAEVRDRLVSTRAANGAVWAPLQGAAPFGRWTLQLPPESAAAFEDGDVADVLFLITYSARSPPWP